MAITTYQANKLNDFLFGGTSFTPSGTYYLGLSTTAINANGGGATEPAGGGYARVAVTNNKTNFTTSSGGIVQNNTQFEFPESTTAWGTITHVFIADSGTIGGGNILYYDALTKPRTVQTATILLFAINSMKIQLV